MNIFTILLASSALTLAIDTPSDPPPSIYAGAYVSSYGLAPLTQQGTLVVPEFYPGSGDGPWEAFLSIGADTYEYNIGGQPPVFTLNYQAGVYGSVDSTGAVTTGLWYAFGDGNPIIVSNISTSVGDTITFLCRLSYGVSSSGFTEYELILRLYNLNTGETASSPYYSLYKDPLSITAQWGVYGTYEDIALANFTSFEWSDCSLSTTGPPTKLLNATLVEENDVETVVTLPGVLEVTYLG